VVAESRADRRGHVRREVDVTERDLLFGRRGRGELESSPINGRSLRRASNLLDLRQDGERRPRVKRDLRTQRDARPVERNGEEGTRRLLRRAR